jgi:hypothetical protein
MNVYGRVEVQFQLFLTSTLEEGECLSSHYGHLARGTRCTETIWTGGYQEYLLFPSEC